MTLWGRHWSSHLSLTNTHTQTYEVRLKITVPAAENMSYIEELTLIHNTKWACKRPTRECNKHLNATYSPNTYYVSVTGSAESGHSSLKASSRLFPLRVNKQSTCNKRTTFRVYSVRLQHLWRSPWLTESVFPLSLSQPLTERQAGT